MQPVKTGIIGCGAISGAYLSMAKTFPIVQITTCADIDLTRAKSKAKEFQIPKATTVEALLNDPEIELILNLTIPKAHAHVSLAALNAGKHIYSEKPLAITREEGQQLITLAQQKNRKLGCAPDTFMGAGIQTARKLIEDNAIGRPVAFTAFMMCRGHESWHPNPEFYYQQGGGPMLDMGPYYLTALLQLLGPVKKLTGSATIAIPERTITSQPKQGQKIKVETPDHITGTIDFENNCTGTIIQTFATLFPQYDANQPITIYGTNGTIKVPDPNQFDGPVSIATAKNPTFKEVPPTFKTGYGRSIGAADMAQAIRTNQPFRANGDQAFYVLDLMTGFLDSAKSGQAHTPTTEYEKPTPMRSDLPFGTLEM
jgi:predicted dehydrogenase